MSRRDNWILPTPWASAYEAPVHRAYDVERMIQMKPSTITVERETYNTTTMTSETTYLTPQTVRVEVIDNVPAERFGFRDTATVNGVRAIIIGYQNHPTIADTDLKFNDRFYLNGNYFRILQIQPEMSFRRLIAIAQSED